MRVFREIEDIRGQIAKSVVCVGSFDGLHRGHMELIRLMNEKAKEIGGESLVITFDPHPRLVLRGENRLITPLNDKLELLEKAGVDNVWVIEFTKHFSLTEDGEFVQKYLIEAAGAKVVFSGEGHHFGRDKKGNEEVLREFGLIVNHIERVDNISSTAVRDALQKGDIEKAEWMLGRKVKESDY